MSDIIATYSPCCQMLREGDCEESIMHNGLCSKSGVTRATIKLVADSAPLDFSAALEKVPVESQPVCTRIPVSGRNIFAKQSDYDAALEKAWKDAMKENESLCWKSFKTAFKMAWDAKRR